MKTILSIFLSFFLIGEVFAQIDCKEKLQQQSFLEGQKVQLEQERSKIKKCKQKKFREKTKEIDAKNNEIIVLLKNPCKGAEELLPQIDCKEKMRQLSFWEGQKEQLEKERAGLKKGRHRKFREKTEEIDLKNNKIIALLKTPCREDGKDAPPSNLEDDLKKVQGIIPDRDYTNKITISERLCLNETETYYIDIKDPITEDIVKFPYKEFSFDEDIFKKRPLNETFKKIAEIMQKYNKGYKFNIYLLGGADGSQLPPNSIIKSQNMCNEVEYLPQIHSTGYQLIYANASKKREIGTNYTNEDLPYLRAFWMKERIKKSALSDASVEILQGEVQNVTDAEYRRVRIILIACRQKK